MSKDIKGEFRHNAYLEENTLKKYKTKLHYIENSIDERLKGYKNYDGIDFCDVKANGIQIRGNHKQIKGYSFGEQVTIKYDFSNMKECIDGFVNMWEVYDNEKYVNSYQSFLSEGEKWGFD